MRHWFSTIWNTRGLARWILLAGLVIVVVFVVLAVLAPWVAPYDFNQTRVDGEKLPKLAHPSGEHWFGTNDQFFDIWSRMVWGARTALEVIVLSVLFSILIGVPLGLVSGFIGGWVDRALVFVMDSLYALPSLLLAIVFSFLLRGPLGGGIVAAALSLTVHLHPAVLPGGAQHHRLDQGGDVRRGGPGHRRATADDHAQVPVRQRRPVGARSSGP